MTKYAILDRSGAIRKIDSRRTHPSALPVEYPPLPSRATHHIRRLPPEQWRVLDGRVVVTYDITPRTPGELRARLLEGVRRIHESWLQAGVRVEVGEGLRIFGTDDTSIMRIDQAYLDSLAGDSGWSKRWRLPNQTWVRLGAQDIAKVRAACAEHVEACFRQREGLEEALQRAETVDDLAAIDIHAGWPTG